MFVPSVAFPSGSGLWLSDGERWCCDGAGGHAAVCQLPVAELATDTGPRTQAVLPGQGRRHHAAAAGRRLHPALKAAVVNQPATIGLLCDCRPLASGCEEGSLKLCCALGARVRGITGISFFLPSVSIPAIVAPLRCSGSARVGWPACLTEIEPIPFAFHNSSVTWPHSLVTGEETHTQSHTRKHAHGIGGGCGGRAAERRGLGQLQQWPADSGRMVPAGVCHERVLGAPHAVRD